ncbi:MAG: glycoside hydrolase family 3 N-terminal domain-containing protein [Acidimicrobiales bacterium]
MPIPDLRVIKRLLCILTIILLAPACGLSGSDDSAGSLMVTQRSGPSPAPVARDPEPVATVANTPITQSSEVTAPTPLPTPNPLRCLATRQRVAQLLLPLVTQPELFGAQVYAADGDLGGIGLLGQPNAQIGTDLAALQQASFVPLLVASDEEGGSVQRLATLLGPIPSAAKTAQLKTPEDTRQQWVEYGLRVRALGIDVVFGPVLDVGSGPGIESRSFSDDPQVVTSYGRAVAGGLIEAGVTPVFKHFPGHGSATADSHLELPTTPPLVDLRSSDLVPYVEILMDPIFREQVGVMIGHLAVPGLSGELPTSLSPETISGLLRDELGFGGLVFTDAMNMGAIINAYGLLDALEQAIVAGADIAILGSLADVTPALDYLVTRAQEDQNFGSIVDNRAARVLAAKGQDGLCAGAQ